MIRLPRWRDGRQGTGYQSLKLIECNGPLIFDLYLLRYPRGSEIPPHVDRASLNHYRANLVLKEAEGGLFKFHSKLAYEQVILSTRRLVIFRPDIYEHSVTKVEKGTRYVLSLGWLRVTT